MLIFALNIKTEHSVFTSGLVESDCKPVLGDYLFYKDRYYSLTEQRIPYMRDKTQDERFFILTLFAIAIEAERQGAFYENSILQVSLPVGLPPKHYHLSTGLCGSDDDISEAEGV